jgi:GNAT superfamily N-acetyltransferase
MTLTIVPLQAEHLPDAAELAASRCKDLRQQLPLLPGKYLLPPILLPMLKTIARAGNGAVALRDGALVGFVAAWRLDDFRGRPAVYSPEWANGVVAEDSGRIITELYAHLAGSWVEKGFRTHLLGLLAHDRESIEAWRWLGFGMAAVDGLREVRPADMGNTQVSVRRAGAGDLDTLNALHKALEQHLAAPPVFLQWGTQERRELEKWLVTADHAAWLAEKDGEPLAFLLAGPANPEAAGVLYDNLTASIYAAYTAESVRGAGIGTALLNEALKWADSLGHARCAVDFEPMNPSATRFWLRYFRPVTISLVRTIDDPLPKSS